MVLQGLGEMAWAVSYECASKAVANTLPTAALAR